MRKTRVIAFVLASLVSASTLASAQGAPDGRGGRHAQRGMEGRGDRGGPLSGLTISDAEKVKITQIQAKYHLQAWRLRDSLKPVMEQARLARQKGDTAALRKLREQRVAAQPRVKAMREQRIAEIRAALSPENQKAFDAKIAQARERHENGTLERGRAGRAGRAGMKGMRQGRRGRPGLEG